MLKTKVSSGEYASEIEVIRDGLQARGKALETRLRMEVVAAAQELKAVPSKGRTLEQV